jgi:hypothetical protein
MNKDLKFYCDKRYPIWYLPGITVKMFFKNFSVAIFMPGEALSWVHPKITSPWPQPGGPLILGMPLPWSFTLHQKNTL